MLSLSTPRFLIRPCRTDAIPQLVDAAQESQESLGRWLSCCNSEYDAFDGIARNRLIIGKRLQNAAIPSGHDGQRKHHPMA
ncbi:hypothetical protein JHU04_001121 [Brenneria sp. 4F2]|nr:hypothetical protein [Brenneria bubanii]